jgi:signal transduction histidine kinase
MQHNTPYSKARSMKISRKEQKNLECYPGSKNKQPNGLVKRVLNILSLPSLQSKLIVPYVLLTLLLTLFGIFILTRLVTSSIRERFLNQLYESSRVASDGIILQEREHIENLRSMAFTVGVAAALLNHDANKLEDLLLPLAINTQTQILTLVDLTGKEVLTLGFDSRSGQYERVSGKDFLAYSPVKSILNGEVDEKGDKYSALLETKNGVALFTGTPVRNSDGGLAGILLVATYLQDLASDLKTRALADIFFLDQSGNPIATTFQLEAPDVESLAQTTRIQVTDQTAPSHKITLFGRGYQAFYAPFLIRGEAIGWLGVLLPDNYVISTEVTSRNSLSLLFTVGTLLILIIGRLLALNISRPILKLRQMTEEVANGNLQQTITLERSDEVGRLAKSFNVMTKHLRERTAEANKLYQESAQRNQELAQINNRLRMAQLQLVQSEKLASIGQLTAGIVHDVKNPLSAIQGMADLLREDPDLPEQVRQDIDVIYSSSVNANKIITDLLKFARQAPPEVKPCDLRETLFAALKLNQYLIRNADVKVALNISEQPIIAVHDPQQLEQVIINLIQNAIQAMPQGGYLGVELEQVDGTAKIRLQDTGVGISPENMKRIFDPFFTTKAQGTGLGLSTSYGIIASHQGGIRVQSRLGKGTCFTIILPMKPELVMNGSGDEKALVV